MSFPPTTEKARRRANAQLKVKRYCTCGRKFIGNPGWASHQRWADRTGVGAEHHYAGTRRPIALASSPAGESK